MNVGFRYNRMQEKIVRFTYCSTIVGPTVYSTILHKLCSNFSAQRTDFALRAPNVDRP